MGSEKTVVWFLCVYFVIITITINIGRLTYDKGSSILLPPPVSIAPVTVSMLPLLFFVCLPSLNLFT